MAMALPIDEEDPTSPSNEDMTSGFDPGWAKWSPSPSVGSEILPPRRRSSRAPVVVASRFGGRGRSRRTEIRFRSGVLVVGEAEDRERAKEDWRLYGRRRSGEDAAEGVGSDLRCGDEGWVWQRDGGRFGPAAAQLRLKAAPAKGQEWEGRERERENGERERRCGESGRVCIPRMVTARTCAVN